MKFKGKVIVVISQQDWGKMFISKHHYAVELARMGNEVYFLNSPDKSGGLRRGDVVIESTEHVNLKVLRHSLSYPYIIKHKARSIHNILQKKHVKRIIDAIGKPVDIVWSFDFTDTIPMKAFPKSVYKIFMPVDEPKLSAGMKSLTVSDVILSVTAEILDRYKFDIPKFFVNHGVSSRFLAEEVVAKNGEPIQVGLSGNFLRKDIDWPTLITIIEQHKNVVFNFWGSVDVKKANLADVNIKANSEYLEKIKTLENVKVHGMVSPDVLAESLKKVDCFLICYDVQKDYSSGTNYHKVLEYMATGKVIVSNNITTYNNKPELILMTSDRNSNKELPGIFADVINNLPKHNSKEKQQVRVSYAREHTYFNNIKRIEQFINEHADKYTGASR